MFFSHYFIFLKTKPQNHKLIEPLKKILQKTHFINGTRNHFKKNLS